MIALVSGFFFTPLLTRTFKPLRLFLVLTSPINRLYSGWEKFQITTVAPSTRHSAFLLLATLSQREAENGTYRLRFGCDLIRRKSESDRSWKKDSNCLVFALINSIKLLHILHNQNTDTIQTKTEFVYTYRKLKVVEIHKIQIICQDI